jgi:DMSO/TMAO reductase YedYZ molybdopterin-dependent catalytic subunit
MHPMRNLAGTPAPRTGEGCGRVEFIDLETAPEELLHQLGKDERLIPYGGANFGMPLDLIEPPQCRTVPNDQFFVRSNGPIPVIDADQWRLEVYGLVDEPLSISLNDLDRFTDRSQEAFLECAGNSRTRFDPVPPGTPWRNDAVGNAVWEGVALADVLSTAGILEGAVDVVTQGADFPAMRRGLPLAMAFDPEVLIVTRMNGEPLPVAHGGPVRLLVPGWAGIASTKWLIGIEVIDRPFAGFWNTDNYVFWDELGTPLRPVAEMPPKSIIVTPSDGETVPVGAASVAGWAWSGYGAIHRVEVSFDGGRSWREAALHPGERRGWRRWEITWEATPGSHHLMARATDERRLRQPATAPWNAKGYQMNAIQSVTVRVEP